ncbi:MAG: hypothetical protein ACYC3I_06475 [Gemmataceae bacterium]
MNENEQFPRISPGRQLLDEMLIAAFMAGSNAREAARIGKCSYMTVRRKLKNQLFLSKLAAARRELTAQTVRKAATLAFKALAVLQELTAADDPMVRFRAAVALIETSTNLQAMDEFDARLAALEESREEAKGMRYVS